MYEHCRRRSGGVVGRSDCRTISSKRGTSSRTTNCVWRGHDRAWRICGGPRQIAKLRDRRFAIRSGSDKSSTSRKPGEQGDNSGTEITAAAKCYSKVRSERCERHCYVAITATAPCSTRGRPDKKCRNQLRTRGNIRSEMPAPSSPVLPLVLLTVLPRLAIRQLRPEPASARNRRPAPSGHSSLKHPWQLKHRRPSQPH